MDAKYTVIGPICSPDTTEADGLREETVQTCNSMGGATIGRVFCILEGEHSTLGPLCFLSGEHPLGNKKRVWLAEDGGKVCNGMG